MAVIFVFLLIIAFACSGATLQTPSSSHTNKRRNNYGGSYTGKRMAKRMIRRSFR